MKFAPLAGFIVDEHSAASAHYSQALPARMAVTAHEHEQLSTVDEVLEHGLGLLSQGVPLLLAERRVESTVAAA